ncbi:S-adenosyl-L-methionine-dependent methyltransferase [Weissella oryzae SG25]|uniref:S-adenosyl-L-methionine-dependent methyltransferase n=1 Tax=Weissella oryzae (strain DSM 25784 / JCM 18191 / LMG 30913 / SG25) TaxID=1329250 RepID=A0A069CV21_WEIOS|nr:class I SAM-dependent methyltransferase [Weissella oryzae]GAK31289.1 S-adenosyl-L-methionine-dependent methyltransferase [Weissella oryzae SG25]
MDALQLSERLQQVANYVPAGARLADIGSDHAYLPANLLLNQHIDFAVAGEVAKGPYQNVLDEIERHNLTGKLVARLANGLAAVQLTDAIDVVTIAGMGGHLITQILEQNPNAKQQQPQLILQPNTDTGLVRHWLVEHGYRLVAEKMIFDEGHYYEILVAVPGAMQLTALEAAFGPYNLVEQPENWQTYWQRELARLKSITVKLAQAGRQNIAAYQDYQAQINEIEEALSL